MIDQILRHCTTLGVIGYLPAPGTMATIATLAVLYFLNPLPTCPDKHYLFVGLFSVLAWLVVDYVLKKNKFKSNDPSEIVLDEVVGTLITFAGVVLNLKTALIGFVLFRFFDIVKPLGIKKLEQYSGTFGIMSDDIAAGIISNILLRVFITFFF